MTTAYLIRGIESGLGSFLVILIAFSLTCSIIEILEDEEDES